MAENDTDGVKAGLRRRDFWVNSLTVDNDVTADVATIGSVTTSSVSATYSSLGTAAINDTYNLMQNGKGSYVSHLKAEAIISGGMWVMGSAAVATPTNIVLKPAPKSALIYPLGICVSDVTSGATALVYTKGIYNGVVNLVAEGTISTGQVISVGAGAANNCAIVTTAGSVGRGVAIVGAGSAGIITALLW